MKYYKLKSKHRGADPIPIFYKVNSKGHCWHRHWPQTTWTEIRSLATWDQKMRKDKMTKHIWTEEDTAFCDKVTAKEIFLDLL